jgi:hypothetical protein
MSPLSPSTGCYVRITVGTRKTLLKTCKCPAKRLISLALELARVSLIRGVSLSRTALRVATVLSANEQFHGATSCKKHNAAGGLVHETGSLRDTSLFIAEFIAE